MVQLATEEQAQAYLAQIFPDRTFRVTQFEMGWVVSPIPAEDNTAGQPIGQAKLVIDSETGIVTTHPSLPTSAVAQTYTTARRSGRPTGNQIYPHQWRITLRRTREDPENIDYQMTAVSLAQPPEPTAEHSLTINKQTYTHEPRDALSRVAMSRALWLSQQNRGAWPEEATVMR